ncbi:hypothetical protein IOLA_172 [uncultured bacterium]|nr:hypothetical protein IOLA_172 [uncultured bacterium]
MFTFYFKFSFLFLYLLIFIAAWILNFYALRNLQIKYIEQQEKYKELSDKLSENISAEIENTNEEILNLEQTFISNFEADVDQLQKRGDRILLNMDQSSIERYNFYLDKRNKCISSIRQLIDKIIL